MHMLPMIGVILLGWLLVAVVVAAFLARAAHITVRKAPAAEGLPPLVTTPTPSPVTEHDPIGDRS